MSKWLCPCAAINASGAVKCHACGEGPTRQGFQLMEVFPMTDAIKPLPCPFCHRSAEARDLDTDFPDASCPDSECPGNDYWFPINKWNRRPSPESERVREAATRLLAEMGADVAGKIDFPQLGRIGNAMVALKEALSTSPAPEKAKCPTCAMPGIPHEPGCQYAKKPSRAKDER